MALTVEKDALPATICSLFGESQMLVISLDGIQWLVARRRAKYPGVRQTIGDASANATLAFIEPNRLLRLE